MGLTFHKGLPPACVWPRRDQTDHHAASHGLGLRLGHPSLDTAAIGRVQPDPFVRVPVLLKGIISFSEIIAAESIVVRCSGIEGIKEILRRTPYTRLRRIDRPGHGSIITDQALRPIRSG